jgi:hypothetical protein
VREKKEIEERGAERWREREKRDKEGGIYFKKEWRVPWHFLVI